MEPIQFKEILKGIILAVVLTWFAVMGRLALNKDRLEESTCWLIAMIFTIIAYC